MLWRLTSALQSIYSFTALCDPTRCLLHRTSGSVTKEKEEKRKVQLKIWRTGLAHKCVCVTSHLSLALFPLIRPARIQPYLILAKYPSSRDASRFWLRPLSLTNSLRQIPSTNTLHSELPLLSRKQEVPGHFLFSLLPFPARCLTLRLFKIVRLLRRKPHWPTGLPSWWWVGVLLLLFSFSHTYKYLHVLICPPLYAYMLTHTHMSDSILPC